jgi:pyruvate,water dikinase
MGFDSAPIRSEKALFDLSEWCKDQPGLAEHILQTPSENLHNGKNTKPSTLTDSIWQEWLEHLDNYLDHHGYAIYDMDFAKPLPMDHPEPILEILKGYLSEQVRNPYDRQHEYEERRLEAEKRVRPRLRGLKKWAFEKSLNWAQNLAPLREEGLAEIGLGYPVIRSMLEELGERLAKAEVIRNPEDVYWIKDKELQALAKKIDINHTMVDVYHGVVARRKATWRSQKRATPPAKINMGDKYMGFDTAIFLPSEGSDEENVIKGVPTSPGKVTGKARVLHGPEDFDQMEYGEILIAGITTPAWTPLFAMAAAVVTDIGGPLSHGSIVAREYGIPAVLGTGLATRKIRSGQLITVDGNSGTVTMIAEAPVEIVGAP